MSVEPCPGCGALFPAAGGPSHRYIGANTGCWDLFSVLSAGYAPEPGLLERSRVVSDPPRPARWPVEESLGALMGDAYAVQHHGDESPQAVRSVGIHLLTLHGAIERGVDPSSQLWLRRRAARGKEVFGKLEPPDVGRALTIRHLFPGGDVAEPWSRAEYTLSVYETWIDLHRPTVEDWYDRLVVPDRVSL